MKTMYLCCLLALLTISAVAQELQKDFINYKGLATQANGTILANTTVNLQIGLRFGDANATASYIENHAVLTDDNGIFSIQIGNGTLVAGAYEPELWGTEASYISTAINGVDTGTVELMAVPYAISAGNAVNTVWEKNENDDITNSNTGNVLIDADLNINGDVKVDGTLKFNTNQNIGSGDFIFRSLNATSFGGTYIDSPDTTTGKPFYGYAIDGTATAFHYYDAQDSSWKLNLDFYEALKITDAGDIFLNGKVAFNADSQLNTFTDFTLTSLNTSGFGGMYINSPDANGGKPFYGYAIDGNDTAFHYYDAEDSSWKLNLGFNEALKITDTEDIFLNGKVAFNAESQINTSTDFTLTSLNTSGFGGMYINSPDTNGGKPFYGYAVNGVESAFHYYDALDSSWKLFVGSSSSEEALKVTESGGLSVAGVFSAKTSRLTGSFGNTPDLILGGVSSLGVSDDGLITSDPVYSSSDIILRSNDDITFELDTDNNESGRFIIEAGDGTTIFEVTESGQVKLNGSVVHSSDRRLKKNIENLPYGLQEIIKLEPKFYNWKNQDKEHKSLGLIAQEVQEIIKEVVVARDDKEKTLGVSYTELIPVLINAIKEQQNEILQLKANAKDKDIALAAVISRINNLEEMIANTYEKKELQSKK